MIVYFLMAAGLKPLYVAYCKGYPDNIFGLEPHYTFVLTLLGVHYLLLATILAQQHFGSLFFIPK